jgi:hypothetical protein
MQPPVVITMELPGHSLKLHMSLVNDKKLEAKPFAAAKVPLNACLSLWR